MKMEKLVGCYFRRRRSKKSFKLSFTQQGFCKAGKLRVQSAILHVLIIFVSSIIDLLTLIDTWATTMYYTVRVLHKTNKSIRWQLFIHRFPIQ